MGDASGWEGVLVSRARADRMLRAYGAVVAMAAGSALGAPWSLVTRARSDEPIDMRGRPGAEAGQWTEVIAPAICLLEAFGGAPGAGLNSSGGSPNATLDSSDRGVGVHLAAVAEDYAQRLLAWYRQGPVDVSSALQLVLNDALQPDPYLLRSDGPGTESTPRATSPATNRQTPGGSGVSAPGTAHRLRQATQARWEATRVGHRFADNHVMPLGVVCGVVFAGDPATAAASARQMSTLTTVHPLTVSACAWLAAVVASSVGKEDATQKPRFEPLAALEHAAVGSITLGQDGAGVGAPEPQVEEQLRAAVLAAREPGSGGAGLDALSVVARVVGAMHHSGVQYARRDDLNPVQVAVEDAVRAGGDTEMVAALVGAVAGALSGLAKIPPHWLEPLHGWPGMGADGLRDLVAAVMGR